MKKNKQKYSLAIDTSSKFLCVAVIKDNCVLSEYNRMQNKGHSRLLIPVIKKVLSRCRLRLKDIDFLAVNVGPGSFTGLRIGIAAVKGLSLALNKPIVAIPSLDLLAVMAQIEQGLICPVVDAKRQQVYSALYEIKKGKLKRKSAYLLLKIEALLKRVKPPLTFTGDALNLYREEIKAAISGDIKFAKDNMWYPKAEAFARLCPQFIESKEFKSAKDISPFYLYPDTCTLRRRKRRGSR